MEGWGRLRSVMATSTTTVSYTTTSHTDQTLPSSPSNPCPRETNAAISIQSKYRAHRIRTHYKTISSVNSQADRIQRNIQRQETVDALRTNELERLRMNEELMGLLLRLDTVPGIDPNVREARRKVSRRIVGLQEVVDWLCGVGGDGAYGGWDPCGDWWDELVVARRMKEEEEEECCCRERGGEEMARLCGQYLGFRCLQKLLSQL